MIKIVYTQITYDKMAIGYSFLYDDDIVKTEDADFITLCQVSSSLPIKAHFLY